MRADHVAVRALGGGADDRAALGGGGRAPVDRQRAETAGVRGQADVAARGGSREDGESAAGSGGRRRGRAGKRSKGVEDGVGTVSTDIAGPQKTQCTDGFRNWQAGAYAIRRNRGPRAASARLRARGTIRRTSFLAAPVTGRAESTNDQRGARSAKSEAELRLHGLFMRGLDGDAVAYRAFLQKLSSHLRAFLGRRLFGWPDEVEDLVQECLLAMHNQRHTYQSDQPLTAWVHAIARYKMIDLLRAKVGPRGAARSAGRRAGRVRRIGHRSQRCAARPGRPARDPAGPASAADRPRQARRPVGRRDGDA